jgi:ABC-type sugar transport system ATPase subunit
VIYISHRLEEIFVIADRVTVLRDGKSIATRQVAECNKGELINLMVGRELDELFPKVAARAR